jgi:uncharacterized repeat protein (TIGR04076 family)
MPFKVRCTCTGFAGDVESFPCHFDYKIGESFTYDGERFEGRICQGLFRTIIPVIHITMLSGNKHHESILFRYSGLSLKDPSYKPYDGIGFRPITEVPEGTDEKYYLFSAGQKPRRPEALLKDGYGLPCHDCRTSAFFVCEPVDIAGGGDTLPYYRREMDILQKIKAEPGLNAEQILSKYSPQEREEIYPPLTPVNVPLILDELAEVNYIELKDGRAYPKNLRGK